MADQFALEIILLDLSEHTTGLFGAFTPRAVAFVALRLLWLRVEIVPKYTTNALVVAEEMRIPPPEGGRGLCLPNETV